MLSTLISLCCCLGLSLASATVQNPYTSPTALNIQHDYLIDGWTPKPTPAPRLRRDESNYGAMDNRALFARENFDTCGYQDGNRAQPYTCGSGYKCAYGSAEPSNWVVCCPTSFGSNPETSTCSGFTTCIDYRSTSESATGSTIAPVGSTVYCPSNYPVCYKIVLTQSDVGSLYVNYGCWTTDTTLSFFGVPTNSASASSSTTTGPAEIGSGSSTSITVSTPSPFSSFGGTTPTPTTNPHTGGTGGGSSPQTSGPTTPTPKPHHTNVGAIAGGTVGGVVVLAALAGGIWYLVHKKRSQRVEPMREISPAYYGGSQPNY